MSQEYVRICPVCETRNPAGLTRCPCGASLAAVDFTLDAVPPEPPPATPPGGVQAAGNVVTCPHADCAQANPAGQARCLYCNRPLSASALPRVTLVWPWGEIMAIDASLVIGREAPAPPALAARLAREYDNVSRHHAEFSLRDGECWLTDLGSLNGTFVDDKALAAHRPVRLEDGQRVRFGASLAVEIRFSPQGGP